MFSIQKYIHTNALVDYKNESKFGYKIPTQTTMDNGNMTLATYKRAFIIALLLLYYWLKQNKIDENKPKSKHTTKIHVVEKFFRLLK